MNADEFSLSFDETALGFALTPSPSSLLEEISQRHPLEGVGGLPNMPTNSTVSQSIQCSVKINTTNYDMMGKKSEASEKNTKREEYRLKDRIRRQVYLQRRKCEKETLTKEIGKLSKRLNTLKDKMGPNILPMTPSVRKTILSVRDAVEERQRLCAEISRRATLVEDFRRLLSSVSLSDPLNKLTSCLGAQYLPKSSQTALFQQYLQELSAIYRQTDGIFRVCTADMNSCLSTRISTTLQTEGTTKYFQSCAKQLVPFEFRQTCDLLWQLTLLTLRQEDRARYNEVKDLENTAAVKFRIAGGPTTRQGGSLLVHLVIRRYEESDRMVLVWRALTEGEGIFDGMKSDETGWRIVRPSTTLDSCTVVESCTRVVPIHFGTVTTQLNATNQFINIVLKSSEEDILAVAAKLDAMFLKETWKASS